MGLKSRHKVDPAFNTAGMLDVIFILLIFFVINSNNMIETIDANLPQAKERKVTIPNLTVTIQKTDAGLKYFVNNTEIEFPALKTAISAEMKKVDLPEGKIHSIVVKADGKVELDDAVAVTNIITELKAKATFAVNPIQ